MEIQPDEAQDGHPEQHASCLKSTDWTSIFCPLNHSLEAVDGVTFAGALPL